MFCSEASIGLRPEIISSNSTPNAKTSVLSSTIPCRKYSGAKYLLEKFTIMYHNPLKKKTSRPFTNKESNARFDVEVEIGELHTQKFLQLELQNDESTV